MRRTRPWSPDLKPILTSEAHAERGLPPQGPREGQTFEGESLLVRYANLVKLPHTVFALPFALIGVVYASAVDTVSVAKVVLVVLAFTAARSCAMGFNRIVDRELDAKNPRTRGRELPSGKLSLQAAWAAVAVGAAVFVASAGMLNRVCLSLSPVALLWICGYSYTKRFTSWSHLWLGGALAIAPVGGYLAVAGRWSDPAWTLVALAAAVATWVAGFDVFYALQDEAFDREHGLRSAVARLGQARAILLAKLGHGLAIVLLFAFGVGAGLGLPYYLGVAAASGLLVWEHQLVRPGDLSRLDAAFFTMNGLMSVVVFAGALADRLL
ncbi:MAG TPA: UbiA-like polyprenyltransferase [Gemmatimonadales bacterium]|nr:UbiA-like polyprenyltransferase [Gemmatimonadales bacterium]